LPGLHHAAWQQALAVRLGAGRSAGALGVREAAMSSERPAIRIDVLLIFMVAYGAASLFHHIHNAEFLTAVLLLAAVASFMLRLPRVHHESVLR
jgi:hypothetical protein